MPSGMPISASACAADARTEYATLIEGARLLRGKRRRSRQAAPSGTPLQDDVDLRLGSDRLRPSQEERSALGVGVLARRLVRGRPGNLGRARLGVREVAFGGVELDAREAVSAGGAELHIPGEPSGPIAANVELRSAAACLRCARHQLDHATQRAGAELCAEHSAADHDPVEKGGGQGLQVDGAAARPM